METCGGLMFYCPGMAAIWGCGADGKRRVLVLAVGQAGGWPGPVVQSTGADR